MLTKELGISQIAGHQAHFKTIERFLKFLNRLNI
jgi:hypothetical protein